MGIRGLLPRYDATSTPLRELVPLLEAALYSKQAVLALAAAPSTATAASIMAELIRQTQVLRGANSSTSSAGSSSMASTSASHGHTSDAYEEALTGEAYIKFKTAMAGADLLSTAGRRACLDANIPHMKVTSTSTRSKLALLAVPSPRRRRPFDRRERCLARARAAPQT